MGTTRIGDVKFEDIPCLLSEETTAEVAHETTDAVLEGEEEGGPLRKKQAVASGAPRAKKKSKRSTRFTVEAISLDDPPADISEVDKLNWIGINQTRCNRFIEQFLNERRLNAMFLSKGKEAGLLTSPEESPVVKRERMLGNSRIDFMVFSPDPRHNEVVAMEVKTPLLYLPPSVLPENHPKFKKNSQAFNSFHRLVKHFGTLADILTEQKARLQAEAQQTILVDTTERAASRGRKRGVSQELTLSSTSVVEKVKVQPLHFNKCILLLCFMYDAPLFKRPEASRSKTEITEAAARAKASGLEFWQANMRITRHGVELVRLVELLDDY
ncbi:hypothetical protein BZG36_04134 [Bifiguratus adelaidae]|uniref:Uncharacterized protein n=1 Tax=Bifiguratus adelaidae TaxID=1938954 RepID=A0A261XW09_9FUNG|nr:hypothetical protein BZG36_04134 [Bifiguratus adelaidae]